MKLPKKIYNWMSLAGIVLAANSLLVIIVLFLFSLFTDHNNSYLGLYIYIIVPMFLVIGLLMIPLGVVLKIKKQDVETNEGNWPVFNFNNPKFRSGFFTISAITVILLIISAMGSYQAFRYSESVEFCGKLCHKVMEPEYVSYQHSPHARVACVECHVGEGAGWYIKSKMSGLYQVYSVTFKKYARPIETPLHNLRPARETCERCHWPEKFYSRKLVNIRSYLTDSANTEWNNSLLMKIGPEFSSQGQTEGIHWHINKNFKIEYVATANDRETIPWVKMTNLKTGEVKTFMDTENPVEKAKLDSLPVRTMDCMDCHNRPSHLYNSPTFYINNAMVSGKIPKDLPYIKKAAMEALKITYTTSDSAMTQIDATVMNFYKDNYPDILAKEKGRITAAITAIQDEYKVNAFPYMRADATKYLNHRGHLESDGCFRCHSDRHKTEKGETISRDCNLCHVIINQGPTGKVQTSSTDKSLEFEHPVPIKGAWKTSFCSECHKVLYE
ncbi:MAG: NapC/NirT family cytochrome c [Marinilabiliales bacterium]|nr:NapC/NirT family cytochrome c [Marinilabiliales bacterium]